MMAVLGVKSIPPRPLCGSGKGTYGRHPAAPFLLFDPGRMPDRHA
jgi:hypothetical protein